MLRAGGGGRTRAADADRLPGPGRTDRDLFDPYGRTLLYLRTSHGDKVTFVNEWLVEDGSAIAELYAPNDRYIEAMRAAQQRADRGRRRLWEACASFGQPHS